MMRGERIRPEESPRCSPSPRDTYLKGAAFGTMDMKERLQLLDKEGMAKSILYPTIGLLWEAELFDAELSAGLLPRLQPMDRGLLPRLGRAPDSDRASLARRSGGRRRASSSARSRTDARARSCARSRSRASRTAIPRTIRFSRLRRISMSRSRFIRPSSRCSFGVHHRYDNFAWAAWYYDLFAGQGVQHAFGTFFQLGVFDRFPKLKVVVLESGAGWIGYFLDRARRDLHRHHARRDGAAQGKAVVLFQESMLHLGRPRRTHHRRQ